MIGVVGGVGVVDERSYDNNEPSKKALDFDLVMISLFGSTGVTESGIHQIEAPQRDTSTLFNVV